jgi:multicomponent Na+:H+ antiporter subunit A
MALLLFLTLAGFGIAALTPLLYRYARDWTGWILAMYPAALFVLLLTFPASMYEGAAGKISLAWAPSLDLYMSFRLDGLSMLFAWLITGIGALIFIYASSYMKGYPQTGRLLAYLMLFMASMLGLVLADNILALFIFWELTSISSYLLIGYNYASEKARTSALQALVITAGGGLALLAGLVLLGHVGGSYELSTLLANPEAVQGSGLYVAILVLVLIGCFTKSAQFPFHIWLPNAMEAPTPVSAYLHSATMVKAGIYLLARLAPLLAGTPEWIYTLGIFGIVTTVVGSILALISTDLKRILAYTTVAALGMMVVLLSFGTATAAQACLAFLIGHAMYKGALFMLAGAVDHETGQRDALQLGGLRSKMPRTFWLMLLSGLALAGAGPFMSFIGKELALETALGESLLRPIFLIGFVINAIASAALAAVLIMRVFFGPLRETPKAPHETPTPMLIGPAVLGVAGLFAGLLVGFIDRRLVAPAVPSLVPIGAVDTQLEPLAVWHGLNLALGLSLFAIFAGLAIYSRWTLLPAWGQRVGDRLRFNPQRLYELSLAGLLSFATWLAHTMQSGYLRHYITIILLTTIGFVGGALTRWDFSNGLLRPGELRIYEVLLAIVVLGAALSAVRATTRISAIASLGVVGLGTALIYVLFGAPDLAMTQFAVESLTVILLVLVFYHLPRISTVSRRATRFRDAFVALSFGSLMTILVLAANAIQPDEPISTYFAEQSYPLGHGQNVVNVILVDFRAMDTLGEIVVLSLAAIGVYALVKLRPHKRGAP